MDVRNCRGCGRLYNYIGGSYRNLCPDCVRKLEEKFDIVKDYIEENHSATMNQISEDCDVSVGQLEKWVREERLCFADDSPIGIPCENCGKTIKSGRYCEACKNTLANQLGSMYAINYEEDDEKDKNSRARMRYLDRK